MKLNKLLIGAAASLMALYSCSDAHEGWTLKGPASESVLQVYIEASGADGNWHIIDSVAPAAGMFSFELPKANLTIYRVTAGDLEVYVPADSTEVISLDNTGRRSGSAEALLFNAVDSVIAASGSTRDMLAVLDGNLASTAAYYATQRRPSDLRLLQTVANRHREEKPAAGRTAALMSRYERLAQKRNAASGRQETTVITAPILEYHEIELPDRDDSMQRLSDVVESHAVTLLVFADFERPENAPLIRTLGSAAQRGVGIYEVGFDANRHLWSNHSANLPWVNVFLGENDSRRPLVDYMVSELPTIFIISNGSIAERVSDVNKLSETLNKYL